MALNAPKPKGGRTEPVGVDGRENGNHEDQRNQVPGRDGQPRTLNKTLAAVCTVIVLATAQAGLKPGTEQQNSPNAPRQKTAHPPGATIPAGPRRE